MAVSIVNLLGEAHPHQRLALLAAGLDFLLSDIPLAARTTVMCACVLSRGLHQAGAWPLLSKRQHDWVSVAYHKPFRALCGANRPPPEGAPQRSNLSVRLQLKILPLE